MIFLSSTMNMVTQIIYLGRMEVGDWYYTVCFLKHIFLIGFTAVWTYIFRKNGGWRLVLRSLFSQNIFLIGFTAVWT